MANWTKIEPQGTSQRKKWNLEGKKKEDVTLTFPLQ